MPTNSRLAEGISFILFCHFLPTFSSIVVVNVCHKSDHNSFSFIALSAAWTAGRDGVPSENELAKKKLHVLLYIKLLLGNHLKVWNHRSKTLRGRGEILCNNKCLEVAGMV